jgi:hypothetical protein
VDLCPFTGILKTKPGCIACASRFDDVKKFAHQVAFADLLLVFASKLVGAMAKVLKGHDEIFKSIG